MTDNEIIKALENEVKSTEYVDSDYCDGVDLTLIKSAIDLINRQKAQLADERAKIEICAEIISRQDAEIDELKHEREVLIEDIHNSADKNNEQLEEIEKLERTISYLESVCESTPDKVRVEVVKEFADRLLNKVRVVQVGNLTWVWLISQDDINDIIKEMLGEE